MYASGSAYNIDAITARNLGAREKGKMPQDGIARYKRLEMS